MTEAAVGAGGVVCETDSTTEDTFFSAPSSKLARHATRDLVWGEHFIGVRLSAGMGQMKDYLYSVYEAEGLLLGGQNAMTISQANRGAFVWIDVDQFIVWVRDVLGDDELANVIEDELGFCASTNEKINRIAYLLSRRIAQYDSVLRDAS
jgi:hypothetical protein